MLTKGLRRVDDETVEAAFEAGDVSFRRFIDDDGNRDWVVYGGVGDDAQPLAVVGSDRLAGLLIGHVDGFVLLDGEAIKTRREIGDTAGDVVDRRLEKLRQRADRADAEAAAAAAAVESHPKRNRRNHVENP